METSPKLDGHRNRMVRNLAALVLQRFGLIGVGLLFAAVVPRLLGPDDYGRFTLMLSISIWAFIACDLGLTQVISRQLPQLVRGAGPEKLREMLGALVFMRAAAGAASAALFFLLCAWLLPDLPRSALAGFSVAMVVGGLVDPLFAWLIGMHRADLWGFSFLLRRILYIVVVPLGYRAAGLAGASFGLAVSESVVLATGYWCTRQHLAVSALRWNRPVVAPFLRAGILFYLGNLMACTFRYSGETIVRVVTHDYTQVAFFGLCLSVYAAAEAGLLQLATAATPYISSLRAEGRGEDAGRWCERILRVLTQLSVLTVLGALYLAPDVAPLVFGQAFAPAVPNLYPLTATLCVVVALAVANMVAVVFHRPLIYVGSAALRLFVFWPVGQAATARMGAPGASWSILLASILAAALATGLARRVCRYRLDKWLGSLLLALPCAVLIPLRGGPALNVALFLAATAAYAVLLAWRGLISAAELRQLRGELIGRGTTQTPTGAG